MSKNIKIEVTITLSNDIMNREEIADIGENVLIGLKRQAEETAEGLVGDNFDGYTTGLEVNTFDPDDPKGSPVLSQGWDVHKNDIITY